MKKESKIRKRFVNITIGSLAQGKSWHFKEIEKKIKAYLLEKENKEIWILDDGSRHEVEKFI